MPCYGVTGATTLNTSVRMACRDKAIIGFRGGLYLILLLASQYLICQRRCRFPYGVRTGDRPGGCNRRRSRRRFRLRFRVRSRLRSKSRFRLRFRLRFGLSFSTSFARSFEVSFQRSSRTSFRLSFRGNFPRSFPASLDRSFGLRVSSFSGGANPNLSNLRHLRILRMLCPSPFRVVRVFVASCPGHLRRLYYKRAGSSFS
jgi:hypothetical protein